MTTALHATRNTDRVRAGLLAAAILTFGIARSAAAAICLDCPPPNIPPPPPPPSVSVPDFAFQVTPCPPPNDLYAIASTLQNGLTAAEKQLDLADDGPPALPDVRQVCVNNVATVAGWLFPMNFLGSWDNALARNLGVSGVKVMQPGETFGFRVTKEAIDRMIGLAWGDLPKTMNDSGVEDVNGKIHLFDFDVDYYDSVFNSPAHKLVDTRFNGYYSGPFTQTNFFAGVGDYLWLTTIPVNNVNVGRILCTSNPEWGMDTTIETILATVFGALHGVDSMIDAFAADGPACQITSLLPLQTLFGTSGKILFNYTRLNVGAAGITTGGTLPLTFRSPEVKIQGPSPLVAEVGEPATATYSLDITDMRPPYLVTWTANGVTQTTSSTSRTITWSLGNAKPVSYLYKTISAKVVDADGQQASASRTFSIKVVWDVDLPPICHIHPYLPECDIY